MKIDLDSIKFKLKHDDTSLVDPRILVEDMTSLWSYMKDTGDYISEFTKKYYEEFSEFNLLKFTTAYLSDLMNRPVIVIYTEDNYIKIS